MPQNNQTAPGPQTSASIAEAARSAFVNYRTKVREFQQGKAMFLLRVHMWSGRRVQSDQELIAMGIIDIAEYKKTRTKGSKELVPTVSLRPLQQVKYQLEKALSALGERDADFESIYYVPQEKLEDAVTLIMKADGDLKEIARSYMQSPSGYVKDRDAMIRQHMMDVGKDSIETIVNHRLSSAGERPEGISQKEWKLQIRTQILEEFGTEQEIAAALGLDHASMLQDYPSEEYIISRYYTSFRLFPLPAEVRLSRMVEEYEMKKIAEATARTVQKVQESLKATLIEALQSFRTIMREKDMSDKINNRSITKVRQVFDRFSTIGQMVPGTEEIERLIAGCKIRFEQADSWTVEEAKALGIEEAMGEILTVANEMVIDVYRDAYEEGEMFVGGDASDGVGEMERSPVDEAMERGMTA